MISRHQAFGIGAVLAIAISAMPATVSGQWRITGASSSSDAMWAEFFERYARGDVSVGPLARAEALEFSRQLRRAGPPWAGPQDAPGTGRRRLVIATIGLDFINQNFETAWGAGFHGDLLEWGCELLRGVPPAAAERTWHLAAVVLLQRASAGNLIGGAVSVRGNTAVVTHVQHAERRFPNDGEWTLARAIDVEHLVWPPALNEEVLRGLPDVENRLRSGLDRAFDEPAVRDEAHLRWAYFHVRRGRWNSALTEFDAVGQPDDRVLRYWLHLLRGRTLMRMGRNAEAVQSYRGALAEFPHAQSATLALGAALVDQGRADEARQLVAAFLANPPSVDPWRAYGSPAQRHWPALYVELRTAIRP